MKIYIKLFVVGLAASILLILSQSSSARAFKLAPGHISQQEKSTVIELAKKDHISKIVFFEKQSFTLKRNKEKIGSLISGRGTYPNGDRENSTCFLALVKGDNSAEYLKTVGQDEWEAEACISVASVGLVEIKGVKIPKIAIIYKAASPNTAVDEPVIFELSKAGYQLVIDKELSQKCSQAGAITLKKIRNVLNK